MLSKFDKDSDLKLVMKNETAKKEAARAAKEDDILQDLLGVLPKTEMETKITRAEGLQKLLEFQMKNTPNSDQLLKESNNNYRIRRCVKMNGCSMYVWVGAGDPAKNQEWAKMKYKPVKPPIEAVEPYDATITVYPLDEPVFFNSNVKQEVVSTDFSSNLDTAHGEGSSTSEVDMAYQSWRQAAYHPFLQCPFSVNGLSIRPCDWCCDEYQMMGSRPF